MGWQEREAGSETVHFQRHGKDVSALGMARDLLSACGHWQVPITLRARCCGAPRLAVSTGCGGAGVTVTLPLRSYEPVLSIDPASLPRRGRINPLGTGCPHVPEQTLSALTFPGRLLPLCPPGRDAHRPTPLCSRVC